MASWLLRVTRYNRRDNLRMTYATAGNRHTTIKVSFQFRYSRYATSASSVRLLRVRVISALTSSVAPDCTSYTIVLASALEVCTENSDS